MTIIADDFINIVIICEENDSKKLQRVLSHFTQSRSYIYEFKQGQLINEVKKHVKIDNISKHRDRKGL